jgi:hypothetical protein
MGDIIDIIKGRPDGDALMTWLANEIAEIQILAMALQDNGIGFGDVVVPMKFEHLVKGGEVKVLGRPVIAGHVSRVGLVAMPIDR